MIDQISGTHSTPSSGVLTVVAAPASDHDEGLDLKGLVDYLSARTGIPINLHQCKDYKEAITSLVSGTAQIGWLGPFAYKEAASQDAGIEAFAVGVPRGKKTPNYHSLFIVRQESEINLLVDVRHSSIALGDDYSASGFEVPKRELAEVGIPIETEANFKEIVRVDNHDEAIRAMIEGRVDVAPVSSINLEELVASGKVDPADFKIIHQSSDISGAPLVYTHGMAPDLIEQIKTLVLDAHNHINVGGYGGLLERYVDPVISQQNFLESYIKAQWGWRSYAVIATFLAVVGATVVDLEIDFAQLITDTFKYLTDVVGRMMPPDFSKFDALALSMLETIEIALLGTLLAIILSIPVGLFSARNLAPNYFVFIIARTITVFFRAIPEFIMAMILVIAIGFGAMPAVIALGFHTMGFLAKFYAEAIEQINDGPVQALKASGASRTQVLAFAIVPQIMPSFVGNNLYIFDRNIRMATMLGIVGAGGIGYELQSAFRMFEYQRVSAIIALIFATIFVIDMISSYIRSKVA